VNEKKIVALLSGQHSYNLNTSPHLYLSLESVRCAVIKDVQTVSGSRRLEPRGVVIETTKDRIVVSLHFVDVLVRLQSTKLAILREAQFLTAGQ
jgi:hypothetical protein